LRIREIMECLMDSEEIVDVEEDRDLFESLVGTVGILDDLDEIVTGEDWFLLSFDPPSSSHMGWACFSISGVVAKLECSGIHLVPDDTGQRLLSIERFIETLIERYPDVSVMCFERAIGMGFAPVRERISENTGVIKLAGARAGVKFVAIHTSTMAKRFTGSGSSEGKKSRIKKTARDLFFPDKSYREIAPKEEGGEMFEHLSDALGFGCCHLMMNGVRIECPGGVLFPVDEKRFTVDIEDMDESAG
jgi:Holliday junction resolvasome RuvABC endonuclease subunit